MRVFGTDSYALLFLFASGATTKNGEMITVKQEMYAATIAIYYSLRDENVQVNGYQFIMDMTGVGAKHLARMSSSDMRKLNGYWSVSSINQSILFDVYETV